MIKLITHTPNPEELLRDSYSMCYQKEINFEKLVQFLKHESAIEHAVFNFEISASRVCWEQIVRHRLASFTAQSHRYTEPTKEDTHYFIPSEVLQLSDELILEWIDDCEHSHATYMKWRNRGIKKESARYHINKGVRINARVTMNLRTILNFLALRTDKHAQEEIRILANEMAVLVFEIMPNLKPHLEQLIESKQH